MKMLTNQSLNTNKRLVGYEASPGEMTSPESGNVYLQTILMPSVVAGVPIPDGDPTPVIIKQMSQEFVAEWMNGEATLMAVWTPASANSILKIFARVDALPWGHLMDLPLSQPLSESFVKARLVSARLDARSAAQAAGVFTLAGMATGIYTNQIPPFSQLTYNTVISFAPNAGSIAKQIPVCDGITSVFPPNKAAQEFFTPETSYSYNFKELWDYNFIGQQGGWLNSPFTVPGNATMVIWDSAAALPFGYPYGNLPDPFYGNYRISVHDQGSASASSALRFQIKAQYYVADPITWVPALVTATLDSYMVSNLLTDIGLDTGVLYTQYNIVHLSVEVINTTGVAVTFTRRPGFAAEIMVISYDYYRPNVMSPVCITMLNRLNAGQPVSITGTYNYELVPNPTLARNITVSTHRNEDITLESALAVLTLVGRGINLIWNTRDYDRAVLDTTLKSFSTGTSAYLAAGPGLKSRLLSMWRAINPYLSDAALTAGKAGLGALGTALSTSYPMLAPAVGALSSAYLCAPEEDPEIIKEDPRSKRVAKPRDVRLGEITYSTEERYACPEQEFPVRTCDHDLSLTCCECCPSHPPGTPQVKYLAAAPEPEDYITRTVIGTDFVNIVNGKASPLETVRTAYFPVVPDSGSPHAESLAVGITFSSTDLGASYTTTRVGSVTAHYSALFSTLHGVDFLQQLILYGIHCGVVNGDVYVTSSYDSLPVSGPSWQLAAFVALMGIGGPCLYTGGVDFSNQYSPVLTPIGHLFAKMEFAKKIGMKLVFPNPNKMELEAALRSADIIYPGFLCSGLPLTPQVGAICIGSPFDIVLFNMRIMKHRLQMNPHEQRMVNPGKVEAKAPKKVDPGLQGAKQESQSVIDSRIAHAIAQVKDLVGPDHDIAKSLRSKREAWTRTIEQCGSVEAVKTQTTAILANMGRSVAAAEAIVAQWEKDKREGGSSKKPRNKSNLMKIRKDQQHLFSRGQSSRGSSSKMEGKAEEITTVPDDFTEAAESLFG